MIFLLAISLMLNSCGLAPEYEELSEAIQNNNTKNFRSLFYDFDSVSDSDINKLIKEVNEIIPDFEFVDWEEDNRENYTNLEVIASVESNIGSWTDENGGRQVIWIRNSQGKYGQLIFKMDLENDFRWCGVKVEVN